MGKACNQTREIYTSDLKCKHECEGTHEVEVGDKKMEKSKKWKKCSKMKDLGKKDSVEADHGGISQDQPLLLVFGRINGRYVRFMIDTGATRSFVASEAVIRLGMRTAPAKVML